MTICLVPLRFEKVLFMLKTDATTDLKQFMEKRLGIESIRVGKLMKEVEECSSETDAWVQGMGKMNSVFRILCKNQKRAKVPQF